MVNYLNKSKWFGSRPVLCFMPEGAGGGQGGGGGDVGGGGGTGGAGSGSSGGGGTGSGAGSGGTGAGAGSGGGAGQGGSGGPAQIDWKTAPEHFRKGYDELKSKYEPWEKLNLQPDQVGQFHGTYQKLTTTALKIGQELGYDKDEILEVLHEDPIKTLNFLQNKWAEAQAGGGDGEGDEGAELADLVQEHITKALGPIQQRENQRMTQEANNLFERTVHTELSTIFKEEGVDITKVAPEEQFMLVSAASEIMKYDAGALHGLKYEGKTAPIQKAVREAKTFLDKYFMARATRERGAVAGGKPGQRQGQQPGQQDGGKRPTLDELIENPALINARYAEGR